MRSSISMTNSTSAAQGTRSLSDYDTPHKVIEQRTMPFDLDILGFIVAPPIQIVLFVEVYSRKESNSGSLRRLRPAYWGHPTRRC